MTSPHQRAATGSRERILGRVRAALGDVPPDERPDQVPVVRDYLRVHATGGPAELTDLLHENLAEYRAHVHRTTPAQLPDTLAGLLSARGSASVVTPPGLPAEWLSGTGVVRVRDLPHVSDDRDDTDRSGRPHGAVEPDGPALGAEGPLTATRLDTVDSTLTGCAVAIAETGTLVLDGGAGQGRRALTLVPDHHICVVRTPEQVVASLPLALPRLDPGRPLTWISGPSATSDIELERIEGVHGPRRLEVVLVSGS